MLIILQEEDKLCTRDDIDRIISAEIPDPEEDSELYELVKSCWTLWYAEAQLFLHRGWAVQEEFHQTFSRSNCRELEWTEEKRW